MLTYTPNKTKGRVMLPIFMEKSVTENSLAVPYCEFASYDSYVYVLVLVVSV